MHAARYLHYPKLYPIDLFMAKVLGQQNKKEKKKQRCKRCLKIIYKSLRNDPKKIAHFPHSNEQLVEFRVLWALSFG